MTDEQANEIKRRHRDRLLKIAGVQGIGIQQDQSGAHCLVVMTDHTVDPSAVPAEVEGLPVSIEQTGHFRAFS
jgi:hypothetical protein